MPTLFAPMETILSSEKHHDPRPYLDRPGKAAMVLAWVSGLLAIPGFICAVIGVFLVIPPVLFVLGTELLVGYIKEAKGNARKRSFWIRSVGFNSILLVGALIFWLSNVGAIDAAEGHLAFRLAGAWQAMAIYLSRRAMIATGRPVQP